MAEIPEKPYYKVGEVCKYTDTQPYVLRFWESEFPQLSARKDRGGQRVYTRDDVEVVLRIKQLLYDQEYTIADARRLLETEAATDMAPRVSPAILEPGDWKESDAPSPSGPAPESYRASYDAAREEVGRLRALLAESEGRCRQMEQELQAAQAAQSVSETRSEKVAARLTALLEAMTSSRKTPSQT